MERKEHFQELFYKYIDGAISNSELSTLTEYINSSVYDELAKDLVQAHYGSNDVEIPDFFRQKATPIVEDIWRRLDEHIDNEQKEVNEVSRFGYARFYKYVAAAILVFAISGIGYYYLHTPPHTKTVNTLVDIEPGADRATLTLSDGSSIALSEKQEGLIVGDSGMMYSDGTPVLEKDYMQVATLSTPRGGQYQITLPDGSRVWLNAASSLTYPTKFTEDERRVELVGEAYFDIRKSKNIPFRVESLGQTVAVLGTQFNVKAYPEESQIQTTLVEGKVRVAMRPNVASLGHDRDILLQPGQQATLRAEKLSVKMVNTAEFTAWKEGLIVLEKQTIAEVLRQLERWYDVEFVLQKGVRLPDKTLSGEVLRDLPLSMLLTALEEQTQLKFDRTERRVMISH